MSRFKPIILNSSGKATTKDADPEVIITLDFLKLIPPFISFSALCIIDLVSHEVNNYVNNNDTNLSRLAIGVKSQHPNFLTFVDNSQPSTLFIIADCKAASWSYNFEIITLKEGNEALVIKVIGELGKTINWTSEVNITANVNY